MFTVREAAKRIGISTSKLYQMVERREIAYYRVGGKILLTEADLQAFLAGCRMEKAEAQLKPPPIRLKHLSV